MRKIFTHIFKINLFGIVLSQNPFYLEDRTVQNILPAYTLPSANAVIVISEILEQVKIVNPNFSLSDKMEQAVNETINWICEIQNSDGGFGIKRGEKSRIGNTARIIMALCDIVVHENLQAIPPSLAYSIIQ